tara:strand:+ start:22025 stop:24502 length:2478 start_codon:yes stop_codon:yes gene_type:complete
MNYLYSFFPDDFVSNEEKNSPEYGLKIGRAIDTQWFQGQLSARRRWIEKMRAYSRGEQTTDYKRMIEGPTPRTNSQSGGDPNKIGHKNYKIDYTETLRILPVFKDILTNAIDESLFKPKAEAIDITAVNKKRDYFQKLEQDFYTQDFAQIISQGLGIDVTSDNTPKTERDLNMMKMDYKPKIEVAQELAIENVFKHQKFEMIKDKVDEDLVDLGIGVVWHHTDNREGIKMKYIDPYYFIHSSFEEQDGRDLRYKGVVKKDTIGELMKISDRTFSDSELLKLKNLATGNANGTEPYDHEEDSDRLIEYIVFEYAVHKSRVFKKLRKNKSIKLIDRSLDGYDPANQNKKIKIPYVCWYEGIYVPTAQLLLKWEEIPNQVEKEANNPVSNFVVMAPKVKRLSETGAVRFNSLTQRAVPIVDDIHRDWYKLQQLKMELRPNTVTISPKAISKVVLNGSQIPSKDVMSLFFGRGILLADEFDEDGEPIGRSIKEENGGINNNAIMFLSQEFSNNYNRLRTLMGINEVRDGTTTPNSKTAVTVQKILLASSNNATNHIVKGSFNMSLSMAEVTSLRLYDVLTTKVLKDKYMNIIGSDNVDLLDAIKELPMHRFAIYFDFKPDNEERLSFEQSLITAFEMQQITVPQYNKARQIRNTKSAVKYLEYCVDENTKQREAEKIRALEAQSAAQAKTNVIAEQAKQQTVTAEYMKERNLLLLKYKLEDESKRKEALTKELMNNQKHIRDMELKELESRYMLEKENLKEDRKDERVDQQSQNQAVLIEKRKDPSKQVNFERGNNNDSIEARLNEIFSQTEVDFGEQPLPTTKGNQSL